MHSVLLALDMCNGECVAFLALVDVVDLIHASAKTQVMPKDLLDEVEGFLKVVAEVWGFDWMIPKFEWTLHYSISLELWEMLLDCFVLERQHREPKRFAKKLKNIAGDASRSLLMEVTSQHIPG